MFSKPVYPIGYALENTFTPKKCEPIKEEITIFTYKEYEKNGNLKQFKLPQLKTIAKQNKIPVTATKPILIERLENHFKKSQYCVKIQKVFRGSLVRQFISLKGRGFKNISICVNETDFITLEPLNEISTMDFFSYTIDGITYGCDLHSLGQYIKKNGIKQQPYNQSPFPKEVIDNFYCEYQLLYILSQACHKDIIVASELREPMSQREVLRLKLEEIRNKPVEIRIRELFLEIDLLGNYTNSNWFSQLTLEQLIIFYRGLSTVWYHYGRLTNEVKEKIFILGNPFIGYQRGGVINNIHFLKDACLYIFENFVYGGIDIEHRKLGAIHALSALTLASINARNAMYWLYESIE